MTINNNFRETHLIISEKKYVDGLIKFHQLGTFCKKVKN
jgi:hypothetical protein